MTNTYTWQIVELHTQSIDNGPQDVVYIVDWTLTATSPNNQTATLPGSIGIPYDSTATFTPYTDLKPEQIISWIESTIAEDTLDIHKKNLDNQIIYAPVAKKLPWEQ
jgi:hypothetical protein